LQEAEQLWHLPTALQAACILYVGIQLLLPGEDAGIDLGREYEMARGMVGG
jgi:hypothetical protein